MSDDRKLTLTTRKPLSLKGREGAAVRPPAGGGRKAVVVERRRKRVIRKPGEEQPAAQQPATAQPPAAEAEAPAAPPASEPAEPHLTPAEIEARKRALEALEKERERLEEERRRLEEEAARREEERRRQQAAEEALRRAAEEEAKARGEEPAPADDAEQRAEEEARHQVEEAARREREERERRKAEKMAAARPATDLDSERRERARREREEEERRIRARRLREEEEERRKGKLTVARVLAGDLDEDRPRSLAAFRRAQAKRRKKTDGQPVQKQKREVVIPEAITVKELAERMAEKGTTVIRTLMKLGVMATINDTLDQDTAELVVVELGHEPKRVSEADVEQVLQTEDDRPEDLKPRPPVVTVMGHVDHGKTSLLDALRETDVAAHEAGGITQHIGAYQVVVGDGARITFIDTPGHEAFTQMRARGAQVTDIVVLVVAADDGVMPQTVEAINHARAAGVPMIVAINKIDKPGADPDRIRQELLQYNVQVEKLGGDVLDVEVSALKRQGLDDLVEAILLQAELLDLKANPDRPAEGVIIEAKLEQGRGPVATVLVRRGTLRVGDVFVAGAEWGRVRAMMDERGRKLKEAGPSQPVEVLGLQGTPEAGDDFVVVGDEAKAREVAEYRKEQRRRKRLSRGAASVEQLLSRLKESKAQEFPVIVKADVQGSLEAIVQALEKIGNDEIRAQVIHAAVGGITETDVTLAEASDALIIGFNVRANRQAREAAEREGVAIRYYGIIYDLIEDVKEMMAGRLGPQIEETVIGRAEVRAVFQAGKAGKAAGCLVTEGVIRRSARARLMRDDVIVYDGKLSSLRRFKDDVDEVRAGTECGLTLENFTDIKPGDIVEAYETKEVARTL
ncbi:MAG: hypothetical protein KatS3mg119_0613 [Rhodothalassiaceae bacterium]|nr:MAG: hypothetical protein KatS3mg119_0613 [Rhodothalassiaceae bacterium]